MSSVFVQAAQIKQTVTYLDIVAAAVLGYDYILTVAREVTLVWRVPWTFGKVLFLLTRYPVFAETFLVLYHQFAVMSPNECDLIYKTIGYQLGTGTLIAESILAVRTWVIWNRNPYIAITLVSGLVIFWTPVFYFLAQSLNSLVFTTAPDPSTPGCFLLSQKNILFVVFILVATFETLILILTIVKLFTHTRWSHSSVIKVLYRDGITNYVYLFILSLCNMAVLLGAPHGYSTLLSALQRVLHAVLSGRVLLHLREASTRKVSCGMDSAGLTSVGTHSRLDFCKNEKARLVADQLASALHTTEWFGDDITDQGLASEIELDRVQLCGHDVVFPHDRTA